MIGEAAMMWVIEALKAVGLLIGTGVAVLVAPLIFVLLFSLVSGFQESTPGKE
jgi:hypothetical protein